MDCTPGVAHDRAQFLGNSESRVLQLDVRFWAFKQGDLNVSDYYHRMKGMADNLRALGETVTDHHLVLNLLQGLNKKFDLMKILIKQSQPFPSFHTVRNDLKLEEIDGPSPSCPHPQQLWQMQG
jgi:hypothetical protein